MAQFQNNFIKNKTAFAVLFFYNRRFHTQINRVKNLEETELEAEQFVSDR